MKVLVDLADLEKLCDAVVELVEAVCDPDEEEDKR